MSASREKKNRQVLNDSGYVDPKIIREQEAKAKARRSMLLYSVIAAAFVVLAAALLINNSGILQRNAVAVTIDGEDFKVADAAYYYRSVYNSSAATFANYGFDTSKDARKQEYVNGQTWFDYFSEIALNYMTETVTLVHAAEAEGFTADSEMDLAEQQNLEMLKLYAASNGTSESEYLKAMFGRYMTKADFVRCVRRDALASAYRNAYLDSLTYSDAHLKAAYDADPDAYDSVSIEYVLFTTGLSTDATEEEKAAALDEAKAKAEAVIEAYENGKSFEESAGDGVYNGSEYVTRNVTSDMLVWAFDAKREAGDTTVVEAYGNGYYAVLFNGRSRNDYHSVTVRHILVSDKETAEDLLAQFKAGAGTEADFATLASMNTTDTGSASTGGLYQDVRPGQMVKAFEDWCFDESRSSGDTGIVESEYGYHVMYFCYANSLPYWEFDATNDLRDADEDAWYAALSEGVSPEVRDGMKYVS